MDHRHLPRRHHSENFKREVLAACDVPGASLAAVAMSFGLNANLVRQWRRGRGVKSLMPSQPTHALPGPGHGPEFVALAFPERTPVAMAPPSSPAVTTSTAEIRIELRRGPVQASISWPISSASDCAAWLRDLLR